MFRKWLGQNSEVPQVSKGVTITLFILSDSPVRGREKGHVFLDTTQ